MSGVNKVILVGRLGADPETRFMPSGGAVTNFNLATSEKWKDKQTGQPQEKTEWHRCVAFNKLAEVCGEYLLKGSLVYVEGSLQTRKWQGQDGQDRHTTEVKLSSMQMLGARPVSDGSDRQQPAGQHQPQDQGGQHDPSNDFDDDIPF